MYRNAYLFCTLIFHNLMVVYDEAFKQYCSRFCRTHLLMPPASLFSVVENVFCHVRYPKVF